MRNAILGLAVVALTAGAAQASILNVDFNGARGTDIGTTYGSGVSPVYNGNGVLRGDGSTNDNPAVGVSSGIWNGITFSDPNTPTPAAGLLDSNSAPTTATLSFANWTFQDNCPGCNYAHGDPANMPLLNDYLGVNAPSTNPTFTIGGLTAGTTYNLYIYGTNGGAGAGSSWSVNGSSVQQVTGNGPSPFATFSSGNDYTSFSVVADANSKIVVTGSPGPLNSLVIANGFQLSNVPEPATLGLLSLGALTFLRRRRSV